MLKLILLTVVAAACNVATIACIKKAKHALTIGGPFAVWIAGIAASILATQFLLLWAVVKGAPLGLSVAVIIVSVMIAAAFMGLDVETGRLGWTPLKNMPLLETAGYALAVIGVLLVGLSQHLRS